MLEGGGDEGEAEEGDEEPGAVGLRRQLLPEPLGVPLAILRDQLLVRGACSDRLRVEEQPGPPHRRDRVLVRAAEPDGAYAKSYRAIAEKIWDKIGTGTAQPDAPNISFE